MAGRINRMLEVAEVTPATPDADPDVTPDADPDVTPDADPDVTPGVEEDEEEETATIRSMLEGAGLEVSSLNRRLMRKLRQTVKREGETFFAQNALSVRKPWAAEKIRRRSSRAGTEMAEGEAEAIVDKMVEALQAEYGRSEANDGVLNEANDGFLLDVEAITRQDRLVKAASLLGREFTPRNNGLVRR
jgi:hypothetical protein